MFLVCVFIEHLLSTEKALILEQPQKKHKHTSKSAKCFFIGGRKDGCWEVRTGNQ
jgi:hypothetical protein